jgi:hypothetical protein
LERMCSAMVFSVGVVSMMLRFCFIVPLWIRVIVSLYKGVVSGGCLLYLLTG